MIRLDPDRAPLMHILVVRHLTDYADVRRHTPEHIEYLERLHSAGVFILSGQTEYIQAGVIIAYGVSRESIETLVADDPYVVAGVSEYEILTIKLRRVDDPVTVALGAMSAAEAPAP